MFKVFISDNLSDAAVEHLKKEKDIEVHVETGLSEDELAQKIGDYDALLVRSATKATKKIIDAGKKLKLIGRAGAGTDNVDKVAASERGILVINAPFGNLTSVAELVYGHIFSAFRYLAEANMTLKNGDWEKKRLAKTARELDGKTIGIIGLGKIGQLVAQRALGFNLRVLAYDPVTTAEVAESVGAELVDLETVLKESDVITVHVPLIPQTKHLLNAKNFKLLKSNALVINCARGGVVDDAALAAWLAKNPEARGALDTFEEEPPKKDSALLGLSNLTVTPHLGGDTIEAQAKVGIELADQIIRALHGELVEHVVNLPFRASGNMPDQKAWNELAEKLARLAAQLLNGASVKKAELTAGGELAAHDTKLLQSSILKGLLETLSDEANVNFINATELAAKKGLKLKAETDKKAGQFKSQLILKLKTDKEEVEVRGTVVEGQPRITFIQDFHLDFTPGECLLISRHKDKPGIIGRVGTALGEGGINIASMDLGRKQSTGDALMVLELDNTPDDKLLRELTDWDDFDRVFLAEL